MRSWKARVSSNVVVLDPCCGTGAYLLSNIEELTRERSAPTARAASRILKIRALAARPENVTQVAPLELANRRSLIDCNSAFRSVWEGLWAGRAPTDGIFGNDRAHCLSRNAAGQVPVNDLGGVIESDRCRRWRELRSSFRLNIPHVT
jgi:hypothetical protein